MTKETQLFVLLFTCKKIAKHIWSPLQRIPDTVLHAFFALVMSFLPKCQGTTGELTFIDPELPTSVLECEEDILRVMF